MHMTPNNWAEVIETTAFILTLHYALRLHTGTMPFLLSSYSQKLMMNLNSPLVS